MTVAHVKCGLMAGGDSCPEIEDNSEGGGEVCGSGNWPSTMANGYGWGV